MSGSKETTVKTWPRADVQRAWFSASRSDESDDNNGGRKSTRRTRLTRTNKVASK